MARYLDDSSAPPPNAACKIVRSIPFRDETSPRKAEEAREDEGHDLQRSANVRGEDDGLTLTSRFRAAFELRKANSIAIVSMTERELASGSLENSADS